jgi:hypothetical protein
VSPAWKGTVARGFTPAAFAVYVATLDFSRWRPSFVVVHNTQAPTFARWHDVPGEQRMRGLASYYRDDQGWSGGPHLFIADDLIWVFTPLTVPGVHSPSWNGESWGMELVGDYDREPFGEAVKGNALDALYTLHLAAGWREPQLRLHREDPKTTHTFCPGRNVDRAELEQGVRTMIEAAA